jgi:hypothetical protein
MSANWEYNSTIKGIIKKIFCYKINSNPIKYKWMVVLNDNLHINIFDDSLDKLNLTEVEKEALSVGRINATKLIDNNAKLYTEFP